MLTEGTDYLLYKHAYHTGGAITGLANSEVSVVATRRFLFIIPQREVSLGLLSVKVKTYFPNNDKLAIQTAVEALVTQPDLTTDALEAMLQEMLPAEQVYPLDALTKLSVWMLFRQVRFKRATGATQVLALKGRANHERFKAFYADALR
jgi:hypothetical protein